MVTMDVVGQPVREALRCPITHLAFISDKWLLAGEGPYVKVFDCVTGELLLQREVLPAARVHGSAVAGNESIGWHIAIFGQKSICILHLSKDQSDRPLLKELRPVIGQRDWVLDAKWLWATNQNEQAPTHLCLAYSHNYVCITDWQTGEILHTAQCNVRCLLYTCRLLGDTPSSLRVASGTVFQQVLLWNAGTLILGNGMEVAVERDVDVVLAGPEGVIFAISFNPDHSICCAASDDRSVRVWDVGDWMNKRPSPNPKPLSPKATLYGHTARVWDCVISGQSVISIGEDGRCCVISLDGRCLKVWRGHDGRGLWGVAVSPDNSLVATGGGDGGIRLWSLTSVVDDGRGVTELVIEIPECALPVADIRRTKGDFPRSLSLLGHDSLLASTDQGYVYLYSHQHHQWSTLFHHHTFTSYNTVSVDKDTAMAAFANATGSVALLRAAWGLEECQALCALWEAHPGHKILGLHWTNAYWEVIGGLSLVTHASDLSLAWWSLAASKNPTCLGTCRLPDNSAIITSVTIDQSLGLLLCGDKDGCLHAYYTDIVNGLPTIIPPPNTSQETTQSLLPACSVRRLHSKVAITSIHVQPGGYIYTTGRDGYFTVCRAKQAPNLVIETLQRHQPERGMDWVETLVFGAPTSGQDTDDMSDSEGSDEDENPPHPRTQSKTPPTYHHQGGHILAVGFRHTDFAVVNVANNERIVSVPCGGGHRSHDFVSDGGVDMSHYTLTYVRRRKIVLRTYKQPPTSPFKEVLQTRLHGRELTSAVFLPLPSNQAHGRILLASGSEDTRVIISELDLHSQSAHRTVHRLHSVEAHRSSVRALCVCPSSHPNACLLFSGGGKDTILCTRIVLNGHGGSPTCEHVAQQQGRLSESDARIMGLVAWQHPTQATNHIVASVHSSSAVAVWTLDETNKKLVQLGSNSSRGRCVLCVWALPIHALLLTGDTGGEVAVWSISSLLDGQSKALPDPIHILPLHQSGVNCLAVMQINAATYLLATGGDDNAVMVSVISISRPSPSSTPTITLLSVTPLLNAHSASLKGMQFLDPTILLTTSIDQRLIVWDIRVNDTVEPTRADVTYRQGVYVDVSDVSSLSATKHDERHLLAVTGVGMEIFSV